MFFSSVFSLWERIKVRVPYPAKRDRALSQPNTAAPGRFLPAFVSAIRNPLSAFHCRMPQNAPLFSQASPPLPLGEESEVRVPYPAYAPRPSQKPSLCPCYTNVTLCYTNATQCYTLLHPCYTLTGSPNCSKSHRRLYLASRALPPMLHPPIRAPLPAAAPSSNSCQTRHLRLRSPKPDPCYM